MPVGTTSMQTATAPQPHSVLDNEHLDLSETSNPTMAAPTQAVASSSKKPLEDALKVR
jgi:hypothetical protein